MLVCLLSSAGSFFSNATAATHRAVWRRPPWRASTLGARLAWSIRRRRRGRLGSVGPRADYERLTFSNPGPGRRHAGLVDSVLRRRATFAGKGIAMRSLRPRLASARDHGATTLERTRSTCRPGHGSTTGRSSRARSRCSSARGSGGGSSPMERVNASPSDRSAQPCDT